MLKKLSPVVFVVAFLFLSAGPIFAEAVVVEEDKIFVADGGLTVLNLSDGSTAECSADLDTVTDATDVVVTNGATAVVTVDDGVSIGVEIVDVSSCLVGAEACEGDATVDLIEGVMDIPCLDAGDKIYNIHMERRGDSMNWEVTIIDGVPL